MRAKTSFSRYSTISPSTATISASSVSASSGCVAADVQLLDQHQTAQPSVSSVAMRDDPENSYAERRGDGDAHDHGQHDVHRGYPMCASVGRRSHHRGSTSASSKRPQAL